MKTNATIQELEQTLKNTNEKHGYQLSFERLEQSTRNKVTFTLKSPSKVKGARISWSGRNLAKASWHAHGHFFEELFLVNPNAVVVSRGSSKITSDSGNWEDIQIGSMMNPVYMSETSIGE